MPEQPSIDFLGLSPDKIADRPIVQMINALSERVAILERRLQFVPPNRITRADLAREMGVNVRTLSRLESLGEGPVCLRDGRNCNYGRAAIDDWYREREEKQREIMERRRRKTR